MSNSLEARYFDGHSSASKDATVVFNDRMREFHLQIADGTSFFWKLEDLQFEQYCNLIEIRNENYSGAILKIEDNDFSEKFYAEMKNSKRVDVHTRLLNIGFSKIVSIAFFLLGLVVFSYFYVLPVVAEKSVALLPESFDNEIGNLFMDTFLNEHEINIEKTKYLEEFAKELNLKNKRKLNFTVVNSNEVNAFALPNGQIVVFSGILKTMESSDALVALLGHEVSHVNKRHSMKMLCRNLAGYITISLLLGDANGVMGVLAENAQTLHLLSYSRRFEQEADEGGLNILMSNNVDPIGMVKLFEQLENESNILVPKIISTHPLTKDRKENVEQIISKSVYKVRPNDKLKAIFKKIKQKEVSE